MPRIPGITTKTEVHGAWVVQDHVAAKDVVLIGDDTICGTDALPSGLVLGQITASGKYGPYDDGASDGREDAAGIMVTDSVFAATANGDQLISMAVHAVCKESGLTGINANGKTDLAAHFVFV